MSDLVRLADCPPGLFRFGETLGFRSEYSTTTQHNPSQPDAYVVESGEYFWGGVSDSTERSNLMVEPLPASLIAAAPDLLELSQFLIERLDDFERDPLQEDDGEYTLRQFAGHVSPAMERLRDALAKATAPA